MKHYLVSTLESETSYQESQELLFEPPKYVGTTFEWKKRFLCDGGRAMVEKVRMLERQGYDRDMSIMVKTIEAGGLDAGGLDRI